MNFAKLNWAIKSDFHKNVCGVAKMLLFACASIYTRKMLYELRWLYYFKHPTGTSLLVAHAKKKKKFRNKWKKRRLDLLIAHHKTRLSIMRLQFFFFFCLLSVFVSLFYSHNVYDAMMSSNGMDCWYFVSALIKNALKVETVWLSKFLFEWQEIHNLNNNYCVLG